MNEPQTVESLDAAMQLAIEQSYKVKGTTYPNPPVGAVILDADGEVVAPSPWSLSSRATTTARLRRA